MAGSPAGACCGTACAPSSACGALSASNRNYCGAICPFSVCVLCERHSLDVFRSGIWPPINLFVDIIDVALDFRFGIKLPRYNQIVNALTWMSHSQALKRMSRDYVIDLYLRPPVR